MADRSAIEWTDATWNPILALNRATGKFGHHCEHVSEGCRFCYAERMNKWRGTGFDFKPWKDIELFLDDKMLTAPLRWRRPRMVFVCSMTDLFAGFVDDEWIDQIFAMMALCPQHTFQVLTKRAWRMREYLTDHAAGGRHVWQAGQQIEMPNSRIKRETRWPLPNVWLGISAERQQEADERIPLLIETPAAVRFVSFEPLLSGIDMEQCEAITTQTPGMEPAGKIDWAIVGGESGPHARPMHPDWARSLRDQCAAAGVPYFFKQWGEYEPQGFAMFRVGKRAAGRLLDGRTHDEFPQAGTAT